MDDMNDGVAIAISWPETLCKGAGGWYDGAMERLGISRGGYYRAGHDALVLVDRNSGACAYYDFGRYHSPAGHVRVRSVTTDDDLKIPLFVQAPIVLDLSTT